jgi:hypothetical protein
MQALVRPAPRLAAAGILGLKRPPMKNRRIVRRVSIMKISDLKKLNAKNPSSIV